MKSYDAIIIGAGAAGLMCAIEIAKRGKSVLILDKANKVGKKILMSGGGRCNFTNYYIEADKYLSHNPHFCKSALNRFTQWDFISLVEKHKIPFHEKTLGQLFCNNKSCDIVNMLLTECSQYNVKIKLKQTITKVSKEEDIFNLNCEHQDYQTKRLVIACGGLSIPTMGASPLGYKIAEQFALRVFPTRAGLVPFTLHLDDKQRFDALSGISVDCEVECNNQHFQENLLFTHRGLSGPAMLQISSYWQSGDNLNIKLLPNINLVSSLEKAKNTQAESHVKTFLSQYLAKRLLDVFCPQELLTKALKHLSKSEIIKLSKQLQEWRVLPNSTEGYRTAEVTLGGVDCDELSSKTFESKKVPGLFFIGEVLDVTGWLGGYNFQWAWSSGWAAGQSV